MTEEELLAEEYICNGKCQDDITKNYVHCKTCTRIKDFLAGLKAGRPQLHDLRKDPNDLPKDSEYKTCLYKGGKVSAWYDKEYDCWSSEFNGFEHCIPKSVIYAWCEIPQFKE